MKTITFKVSFCDYCPFFNNHYDDFAEECTKLDKEVPHGDGEDRWMHPVPVWCPLEDVTLINREGK